MSQDPAMIKAYQEDKDLYATLGTGAFHNNYEDNLEHYPDGSKYIEGANRRKKCKKLLLGISYGMGTALTAQNMHVSVEEAQEIIDNFYKSFPKMKEFINKNEEDVVKYGYVEDLWGRRRRLPDAQLPEYSFKKVSNESSFNPLLHTSGLDNGEVDQATKDKYLKKLATCKYLKEKKAVEAEALTEGIKITNNGGFISRAKRQSTNARIQGSAASMTKKAMIDIYKDKEMADLGFKLLIGVHDELIGECPKENGKKVAERLSYLMSNAVKDTVTNVPFKCDAEIEDHWYKNEYSNMIANEYQTFLKEGKSEEEAFKLLSEDHSELTLEEIYEYIKG